MGAYTNPQEVLDTQTGQYFQNLQSTISQTAAGVAAAYKTESERKRKEIEENKIKINKLKVDVEANQSKLYDEMGKAAQAKPSVDFVKPLNQFVDEYGKISIALSTGASVNRQEDIQKQSQYKNMIGDVQGDIANLGADSDGFYEKFQNSGRMGGLSADPTLNPINRVSAFLSLTGKLPGETELVTDINKPTQRTWNVKVNGEIVPFDGATLKNIHENNGSIFTIIPDTTDGMLKLIQDSNIYNMEMKQNSKGESTPIAKDINEKYLGKEERVLSKSSKPGEEVYELRRPVNIDLIKQDIYKNANVQVAGLLQDTRGASSWYNEIANKGNKTAEKLSPTDLATQEGKDRFTQAYIDYSVAAIGSYQSVMDTPSNVATVTIDTTPTKSKTGTTKTGGTTAITKVKFTPEEIKTKLEGFDKIVSGLIDKVDIKTKGPKGGKGDKRTFMYNKSKGQVEEWDGDEVVNDRVSKQDFLDIMKNQ